MTEGLEASSSLEVARDVEDPEQLLREQLDRVGQHVRDYLADRDYDIDPDASEVDADLDDLIPAEGDLALGLDDALEDAQPSRTSRFTKATGEKVSAAKQSLSRRWGTAREGLKGADPEAKRGLVGMAVGSAVAALVLNLSMASGPSSERDAADEAAAATVDTELVAEMANIDVPEAEEIASHMNPHTETIAAFYGVENDVHEDIIYYADWATSRHCFGPEGIRTTAPDAFNDMFARMSHDPALLAAQLAYTDQIGVDAPEELDEYVEDYANRQDTMQDGYNDLLEFLGDQDNRIQFETLSGKYHTYYQIPRTYGERPGIYQSEESMTDELVLRVDVKQEDGTFKTFRFKIECGYQPVQLEEFPNVPQEEELPPSTTTTTEAPTTTTPTTRPRPTTTTSSSTMSSTTSTTRPTTTTSSTTSTTQPTTTSSSTSTTSTTSTSTTSTTAPTTTTSSTSTTSTTEAPTTTTTGPRPEVPPPVTAPPIEGPGSGGDPDPHNDPENNSSITITLPPSTEVTIVPPTSETTIEPVPPTTGVTTIPG